MKLRIALVIAGLSSGACTHCYADPVGHSSHPRSALVESYVGAPEAFDGASCDALCRVLDGLTPFDAAGLDAGSVDAGSRLFLLTPYPERVQASCAYSEEGSTLSCSYLDRYCETSASCHPAVH